DSSCTAVHLVSHASVGVVGKPVLNSNEQITSQHGASPGKGIPYNANAAQDQKSLISLQDHAILSESRMPLGEHWLIVACCLVEARHTQPR
ncbi:MAG: hypothetical protein V2I76_04855, partial [Roseobacter sp.]|nr:hypothetical protein [Roseobacter sp.]